MIGQLVKHGRSARDARNLAAHLMKDRGARIEIINSAAHDLQSAMDDMQLARDVTRADAAFLHLSLSPSRDMTDDELRQVADIVLRHLGAEEHSAVLVIHDKDRANGKGNAHGHLVVGRVGYDGKVLDSSFDIPRFETAMRLAEHEMGEPATLGRHHKFAVAWMQENGRQDIAQWLTSAYPDPEKPQSSASPAKRQQIERLAKTDLATVTETVRSAWERSDNPQAFTAALAESGFEIQKGQKDGVFLVMKEGVQVGALDRLLKEKRRVIASRMEGFEHATSSPETKARPAGTRKIEAPTGAGKRNSQTEPIVGAARAAGANGRRADSSHSGRTAANHIGAKTPDDDAKRPRRESGRFDEITAARQIEQHTTGWDRLRELRDDLVAFIRDFVTSRKSEEKHFSPRDHEIAATFAKACRFSAENMERLERLDPDLAAYREQYGERCQGLSHEQILENLDAWREQGRDLVMDMSITPDDEAAEYRPGMRL